MGRKAVVEYSCHKNHRRKPYLYIGLYFWYLAVYTRKELESYRLQKTTGIIHTKKGFHQADRLISQRGGRVGIWNMIAGESDLKTTKIKKGQ